MQFILLYLTYIPVNKERKNNKYSFITPPSNIVFTKEPHYQHTSCLYSHHSPSSCSPSPSLPSPCPWRCPYCPCPTPHTLAITLSPSSAGCWACSAPSWSRGAPLAWNKTVFNLTKISPDLHRDQADQDDHHLGHLKVEGLELLWTPLRFFFIPDNLSLNNRLQQFLLFLL